MAFEANITLNKIAASVAHTLGSPYDDYLGQKIKFLAINFRATLLRRALAKGDISRPFLTSVCLPVTCVDVADCCGGKKALKTALRTVDKVPKPLRTKNIETFYYVGNIDKMTFYGETTFTDFINQSHLRFTSQEPRYVYLDDYIYVLNPPTEQLDVILVIDAWEDPTQIEKFKDCDGKQCYSDDDPFPIGGDMYEALETYLITTLRSGIPTEDKEIKINDN